MKFEGELEIDENRGVIYFHLNKTGRTVLRICNLPNPIKMPDGEMLDINYEHSICNWETRGGEEVDNEACNNNR